MAPRKGRVLDTAGVKLTEHLFSEKPGKWKRDTRPWQEWKDALWAQMERSYGYPGLAFLEQCAYRSQAERRCIECGEPGAVRIVNGPHSVICVPGWYFQCAECAAYWRERGRREAMYPAWDPDEYEYFAREITVLPWLEATPRPPDTTTPTP